MQAVLEQNHIVELGKIQTEKTFGTKIGLVVKLFGCWHKQLSRPFTNNKSSYRTCLCCGARKRFDTQNLKTFGSFYYPPAASVKER